MGCYFLPSAIPRLLGVSFGTWCGWLALYGNWVRMRGSSEMLAEGRSRYVYLLIRLIIVLSMGLVVTLILKYQNYSLNPFWESVDEASGGLNKTGLLLAAVSLVEYAYRPVQLFPVPPLSDREAKDILQSHLQPDYSKPSLPLVLERSYIFYKPSSMTQAQCSRRLGQAIRSKAQHYILSRESSSQQRQWDSSSTRTIVLSM